MLGNSSNIKNFNLNQVGLKFFFSDLLDSNSNLGKNGVPIMGPRPKQKTIVFSEIIKPDRKLAKTFYFNKIP